MLNKFHTFFTFVLLSVPVIFAEQLVDYVNPDIGSISHLLQPTHYTVHLPNSMLRFGPQTTPNISDHYVAGKIWGFPLNRTSHRGRSVMTVMPCYNTGDYDFDKLALEYDHDFDCVKPYYYKTILEDEQKRIQLEFTPAEKSAFLNISFISSDSYHLAIQCSHQAEIQIVDEYTLQLSEYLQGVRQYAVVKLKQPINTKRFFENKAPVDARSAISGNNIGVILSFMHPSRMLNIKYGISYIDYPQAEKNLQKELPNWDFKNQKKLAKFIWNQALGKIQIKCDDADSKTVFYTAMYRTYERMVNISEDGQYYSGYDHQVHKDDRDFYVDDWSWDSYRAHHPLRLLLYPKQQADIISSYVRMYEQSGWLPSFPKVSGDTKAMIGHHQAAIIADAWQKNVRNFDAEKAYEALRKNAYQGTRVPWREGPACELDEFYLTHGYFPALNPNEKETVDLVDGFERRQSVAVTLEHAYDDWCLLQLAESMGKSDDAKDLSKRAEFYKNVFNPNTGFMSPKNAAGKWVEPFDPKSSGGIGARDYFAEVNGWMYTFQMQHHFADYIDLFGGDNAFVKKLDQLFETPPFGTARWTQHAQMPDATGLVGQFTMGDEQSFHVPYLYTYAGAPWKTQKRIRQLLSIWFRNDLMGICGDEDGGAMSAFYIFSAIGFYPVSPGAPEYVIGSPLFDAATIALPNGKSFRVIAKNNSAKNKYIQSASLNGAPFNSTVIQHANIVNGGSLVLKMGPLPNRMWGK